MAKECHAVFATFAVADCNRAEREIDILNTEPQALEDAHTGSVEKHHDQLSCASEAGK